MNISPTMVVLHVMLYEFCSFCVEPNFAMGGDNSLKFCSKNHPGPPSSQNGLKQWQLPQNGQSTNLWNFFVWTRISNKIWLWEVAKKVKKRAKRVKKGPKGPKRGLNWSKEENYVEIRQIWPINKNKNFMWVQKLPWTWANWTLKMDWKWANTRFG